MSEAGEPYLWRYRHPTGIDMLLIPEPGAKLPEEAHDDGETTIVTWSRQRREARDE